ncbi:MAG: penicillin-binding protein 2, partial [Thermomicrobiaceae bacterium]|nr:penicillin-binding protein 2 [Thermomicrobiaceae bacterium]
MRRGHKRMELVRPADRKGRRGAERPGENPTLSRRAFLFKGLMLSGFGALTAKLWQMQIVDARSYKGQAEENGVDFEPIKAPRGLIVDRNGKILAENRVSWTVAVVPSQLPDDEAQRRRVRDELIRALGLKEMLVVRRSALPLGSEEVVVTALARAIGDDPDPLVGKVVRNPDAPPLVVVRDDLAPADADRYRPLEKQLPGVHVLNRLDYLLELNAGAATPVVLKKDCDREVALSLEANRFYLPGVKVSDDTLVRRYPAGKEFSHILGYVGPISKEEYDAARAAGSDPYLPDDNV